VDAETSTNDLAVEEKEKEDGGAGDVVAEKEEEWGPQAVDYHMKLHADTLK